MKVPFVNLAKQYLTIQEEIDLALKGTLLSGNYILGEQVRTFEDAFAAYCGARYAIGVGSGTEALHLSLLACGIKPGDEVITPPNIAVPTICAIVFAQGKPVLVDVDPFHYTLDPNKLEDYLKKKGRPRKNRFIIPVHLYGHPADMGPIMELAETYNLTIIEDAAQAHGSEYKGKKVGTFGQAGCFSFYPTKNLGALGDAGMVVTQNDEVALEIRRLRNYGEEAKYNNTSLGFNSRLDEMQAAVLQVKLKHLEKWNALRRQKAELYHLLLADSPVNIPFQGPWAKHIFHLYVIRSKKRDALQQYLAENQIMTSVHYPRPVHIQQAYRYLGYQQGDFPVTEQMASEVLSLPLYPELEEGEIQRVCDLIHAFG